MSAAAHEVIDHRLAHALHVASLPRDQARAEARRGGLFQVSTVDALFAGDLEGDLTFAELAEHGDLGLGTLDGLDGEMIALDGRFLRADVDGRVTDVPAQARTPFAVVTRFRAALEFTLQAPLDHDGFLAELDRRAPPTCALRVDGRFDRLRLRSVARQPPHTSLADAARAQHVFELDDVEGTLVGFRFPDYAQGLEVPGYHLHFVDAARERGGHVLECRPAGVRVRLDPESDLHVELPPGIELGEAGASAEQIREVEG
jgi:acetolactate decarboxylase